MIWARHRDTRFIIDLTALHPWVSPKIETIRPSIRLLCLPYAGGGVGLYRTWSEQLPPSVSVLAVHMPGREGRFREPAIGELDAAIDALADGLAPLFREPFALFGHSMGALLAHELALRVHRDTDAWPQHLFLSARRPPHLDPAHPPMHALPVRDFVHHVQAWYDAFPQAVMDKPGLLEPFLPTLRADMRLLETYTWGAHPPMDCPVTVLGGLQDPAVPVACLRGWQQHTRQPVRVKVFSGRHFYVRHQESAVLNAVREGLGLS